MKKKIFFILFITCSTLYAFAQPPKTELYDFVRKLLPEGTGYENVGGWATLKSFLLHGKQTE